MTFFDSWFQVWRIPAELTTMFPSAFPSAQIQPAVKQSGVMQY
jgi:hypothetical protein